MHPDPIVIVAAARTPMGAFQGELKGFAAPELGAAAIRAAVERARISPEEVQEVIMGCVLPAGQGQAPARQASLGAGLPLAAGCTTVNKMCGSGMKAAMFAHDLLASGTNEIIVAGGMESMTNAPYLLPKARSGYRMGHAQVIDHMFCDGLEDAYDKGRLMGSFAEECAQKYQFSREAQDDFAINSLRRAQKANREGWFAWEITPLAVKAGKEEKFIEIDEQPFKANLDKIPTLKPAFRKDGTVTAANSSSISDGAAALVLMRRSTAERRGLAPLALIAGHATHAQEPGWFTTAPVAAMAIELACMLKRQLQALLDRSRFLRPYRFRVVAVKKGKCTLELPHRPVLDRPGGIINGPALMAAADCAMWLAIKAHLGVEQDALTSELSTAFLSPAKGEHVYCGVARCHGKQGRL